MPLNISSLSEAEDGWLCGFIDSDGSFSVLHTKLEDGAKKRKVACRLRIAQRIFDPITNESYAQILSSITNFLNCSLLTNTPKSIGNTYYTLAASSKISLNIIIEYLDRYPLFSSKYLDYKDWKKVALLIIESKHLTEESLIVIDTVKNNMNRQRTFFNWDHLNEFI